MLEFLNIAELNHDWLLQLASAIVQNFYLCLCKMQFEDYLHFDEHWIFALQSNYENSFHWFFYNLHNLDFECVQKLTRRREFLEFSLSIISTQLRCDASDVKILTSHCDNPNNSKVCLVSSPISHLYKNLTHFKTLLQFLKFRQNGKSWYFTWSPRKKVFDYLTLHYCHNVKKKKYSRNVSFNFCGFWFGFGVKIHSNFDF